MLTPFEQKLMVFIRESLSNFYNDSFDIPEFILENPAEKIFGDLSCNIAMKSAKILRKPPIKIAEEFVSALNTALPKSDIHNQISKIEFKAPGFINFYLSSNNVFTTLEDALALQSDYGKLDFGKNEKLLIEFVSANPTGSLSVAHARQAAVGDALVNILRFIGFEARREYYINDGGNQIRILGQSLRLRGLEILGESVDFPVDCYQGEYIKDMAQLFMNKRGITEPSQLKSWDAKDLSDWGCAYLLNVIKDELKEFGVTFDCWTSEKEVATPENIDKVLALLKDKGLTYEKDGALWFRTTDFGDDKDRVLKKTDGAYTYLTPDIVYHKNKFDRGFSRVFNILGPDHHGYIARLKAAAQALGRKAEDIEVLILQLATIYKNGQVLSMSTRKGQYITLREVLEEVGKDAARFFFLMRHMSAHLEFDLELAKKQNAENPVYYVQYAHARIFSVTAKAKEAGIVRKLTNFSLLTQDEEIDLVKKIAEFSKILYVCYKQMDPYPLVNYLMELGNAFHKFYDKHRVVDEDRELSSERLALCDASRIVFANGLTLLGVSAPEKM